MKKLVRWKIDKDNKAYSTLGGNKMRQTVCENIMVPEGQFGQTVCLILFPPVYRLSMK